MHKLILALVTLFVGALIGLYGFANGLIAQKALAGDDVHHAPPVPQPLPPPSVELLGNREPSQALKKFVVFTDLDRGFAVLYCGGVTPRHPQLWSFPELNSICKEWNRRFFDNQPQEKQKPYQDIIPIDDPSCVYKLPEQKREGQYFLLLYGFAEAPEGALPTEDQTAELQLWNNTICDEWPEGTILRAYYNGKIEIFRLFPQSFVGVAVPRDQDFVLTLARIDRLGNELSRVNINVQAKHRRFYRYEVDHKMLSPSMPEATTTPPAAGNDGKSCGADGKSCGG